MITSLYVLVVMISDILVNTQTDTQIAFNQLYRVAQKK